MANNTELRIPIGISNFADIIENELLFIDKTLLIRDIMNDGSGVILITRPRRFGKTLNLSILKYYLDIAEKNKSRDLFKGLNISNVEGNHSVHKHKYPVIMISFKAIKPRDYAQALSQFGSMFAALYREFRYLLDSRSLSDADKNFFNIIENQQATETNLSEALKRLSELLFNHHNEKAIILIDEYDTPLHTAYSNQFELELLPFISNMMGQALKDNNYLHKAVITGILRVSKANIFSELNNLNIFTILTERYSAYFGFTPNEVKNILDMAQGYHEHLELATEWYNGYEFAGHTIFNPWSVLNFIHSGFSPRAYWVSSGSDLLIRDLLRRSDLETRFAFEQLMQGKNFNKKIIEQITFQTIRRNTDALWSLLLASGYLKATDVSYIGLDADCKLSIPNRELMYAYDSMIKEHFYYAGQYHYERFISSLIEGNYQQFQERIQGYLHESASYFDLNEQTPEQVYHMFALGLVVGLRDRYLIQSNRESGAGRYDVMLIPHDKSQAGFVLEFKTAKDKKSLVEEANAALKQISEKGYAQQLRTQGVNTAHILGIAFAGKTVHIEAVDEG